MEDYEIETINDFDFNRLSDEEKYSILVNWIGISEEAVNLVLHINGSSREIYHDILFCETEYRDFEQLITSEPEMYDGITLDGINFEYDENRETLVNTDFDTDFDE